MDNHEVPVWNGCFAAVSFEHRPEGAWIMARTVSIGRQDFEKIRINNNFYVDKTHFIRQWWEAEDDVTLITRPRRFGKTLNMSMLEQFFSVKYAGRSDLFEGLSIWEEEKYRLLQGTYPVIALSSAKVKGTSYQDRKGIPAVLTDKNFSVPADQLHRQFQAAVHLLLRDWLYQEAQGLYPKQFHRIGGIFRYIDNLHLPVIQIIPDEISRLDPRHFEQITAPAVS